MDQIIEAILKAFPFTQLLEKFGLSKELSILISTLIVVGIFYLLILLSKMLINKKRCIKEALEDIKPQFDHLSIKKAKQYYIPTQYQNASPSRQEEPGFTHKYIARNKLIPFFIKTAFNEKIDSERFYLILADSGMGKTTFMINLYFSYHSFLNRNRKHKLKLFRFSNPDTISQIKAIQAKEARNTILLLDALDEDLGIISTNPSVTDAQAFQNRIDEIVELTKSFREVVLTCRTQYFPGQEDDPYELKVRRPDEKGFYTLNKLYISPFNEKEVKLYLKKKYGNIPFLNQKKKKRALKIISKSKNLVMRPMLLSYIDYLTEDEMTDTTTYKIYETLVNKWLLREAEKRKGFNHRENFIENLKQLSFRTAIEIFLNWKREGRMYITKEEAHTIAKQYNIELKPEEITGQSLLTCDGVGNWKFAHKSILEFFLAQEAYVNPKFLKEMNFKGMDMAKKFHAELKPRYILVEPQNLSKENLFGFTFQKSIKIPDYYIFHSPITKYEYVELIQGRETISKQNLRNDNMLLSLAEACKFCNIYNKKFGYGPVYDDTLNLLDPNQNVTKSLNKIRGFRLPTSTELSILIFERQIYSGMHRKFASTSMTYSIQIASQALKKLSPVDEEDISVFRFANQGEFCYDGKTARMLDVFSNEKWHFTVNDMKSFLQSNSDKDFWEQGSKLLSTKDVNELRLTFRLVFIP